MVTLRRWMSSYGIFEDDFGATGVLCSGSHEVRCVKQSQGPIWDPIGFCRLRTGQELCHVIYFPLPRRSVSHLCSEFLYFCPNVHVLLPSSPRHCCALRPHLLLIVPS